MLTRLRYLATGSALGLGMAKVMQAIKEDPSLIDTALGTMRGGFLMDPKQQSDEAPPPKKNVALVRMAGTIAPPSSSSFGDSSKINLSKFDEQLTAAFKTPHLAAVAIEMNSPGGSPVQSALLHNRLRALKAQYPDVPLLCYCTDVAASGGYYIAAAADEIHVLPSSLVGSIGVVSPSLGVSGLMKQYGVDDRTLTAGTSKVGDSPLQPPSAVATAKKQLLLDELHDDFKHAVTAARGAKLQHAEAARYARQAGDRKGRAARAEALFDGSVYAGKTAVRLGLADGLYEELNGDLKARFGSEIRVRELKGRQGLFESLRSLQEAGAEANASALVSSLRMELSRAGVVSGGEGVRL